MLHFWCKLAVLLQFDRLMTKDDIIVLMSKFTKIFILGILLAGGALATTIAQADDYVSTQTPVYRLYNEYTGEHFYTTSTGELNVDVNAGWTYEGRGWMAPTTGTPVYRLFNPHAKGGDHYYTMSVGEANSLVAKGWRWDNNKKPVFYSGGNIPVYVAFNPHAKSGSHNYTINGAEQNSLLRKGWKYSSTAFESVAPKLVGWEPGVQRTYTVAGATPGTTFADNLLVQSDPAKLGILTFAVDANLNVSGSGNGYHGKLMLGDNVGDNVSFGIQVDNGNGMDNGVWVGKGLYISENIADGGVHAGGTATYTAYGPAPIGQTIHVRVAYYGDTKLAAFFVNGKLVGSQNVAFKAGPSAKNAILNSKRTGLSSTNALYMISIQGAAKDRGDSVSDIFTGIQISGLPAGYKQWDATLQNGGLNWWNITAHSLSQPADVQGGTASVAVSGTSSIPSQYDWDVYPGNEEPVGGIQIPVGIPNN